MARLKTKDGETHEFKDTLSMEGGVPKLDGKVVGSEYNQIVYNAIQTPDGTILVSKHRHDYNSYIDKNGKTYMVDGGNDYLKRSINEDQIDLTLYEDSPFESIREVIGRSGFGKDGKGDYKSAALKDMEDEWVANSIPYVNEQYLKRLYQKELDYRKENNITKP